MSGNAKSIVFETIKSPEDNRQLEQDEKGYYKVNFGALNVYNTSGEFYTSKGVEELIKDKSTKLYQKLKDGMLGGEADHPEYVPNMSKQQFFSRNLQIQKKTTSHHIRSIELTPTDQKSDRPGHGNVILVEGWVKPSDNEHGRALKASLDNPEENTCFSVRSFTEDNMVHGVTIKRILTIVTWDWVTAPGIKLATKWKKLSIESDKVVSFIVAELMQNDAISPCYNCSLEDAGTRAIANELIESIKTTNTRSVLSKW